MEYTRDHVTRVLRRAGYWDLAELAESSLPDRVELDQLAEFLQPHGVTHDELIGGLGGSP
jgi:hypothetical protein